MSLSPVDLRVDWCSYEAAKYAVEHWHYSNTLPVSKPVFLGVWENLVFVGSVIFALGASPSLGSPYGLNMWQCCELVRVALAKHESQTSQVVTIAMGLVKKQNPGLRLMVSFADPFHGHNGIIYQAMNWVYVGKSDDSQMIKIGDKFVDPRRFNGHGWNKRKPIPAGAELIKTPGKHRYLYPLDRAMRRQIEPLRQPYPKRQPCGPSVEGDTLPQAESQVRSLGAAS